jgi:hypothetical protein
VRLLRRQAQGDRVHPERPLARQILERLGVDATGPPVAKARAPEFVQFVRVMFVSA